jgi:RNA polymerase sigma-70 factor (ECF subfamily)
MPKTVQNRIIYDHELIQRLQQGDQWVYHLLVRRFRERLFDTAFGITLDETESRDIVTEVFFQVHAAIDDVARDRPLLVWLQRLTVNRSLTLKRRWARLIRWRNAACSQTLPHATAAASCGRRVETVLKRLPDRTRTVWVLKALGSLTDDEIADAAKIEAPEVRSRLLRARATIQANFQLDPDADKRSEPPAAPCGETQLVRYLDGDLDDLEKARLDIHMEACQPCRQRVAVMSTFSRAFQERVQLAAAQADFASLEKKVLSSTRMRDYEEHDYSALKTFLKFAIPAAVITGLMIFFAA